MHHSMRGLGNASATPLARVRRGRPLLPRPLLVAAAWAAALLLIGGAVYLGVRVLLTISFVLVPCVGAVLLTALLQPVNRWMQRAGLGRAVASALALIACVVVVLAIGGVIIYVLANRFDALSEQFRASLEHLRTWILHGPLPIGPHTLDSIETKLQDGFKKAGSGLAHTAISVAEITVQAAAEILLGLFVLFFLLYDGNRIWMWITNKITPRARGRVRAAGEAAWVTLSGYVHGTLLIAVIHGVVIGLALFLLGVPVFLPLGLLVFVGSFIPVVGALVAGGVSVLIALGTKGIVAALILLGVLLLEDELEAHVLQPFVVGRYVRLHPVAIVLVLAAGTWLGGIVGALIAVPLTGVLANAWRPLRGRPSVVVTERARRTPWYIKGARVVRRAVGAVVRRMRGGARSDG